MSYSSRIAPPRLAALVAAVSITLFNASADAASYASGITVNGTTVTFTLNEPADLLTFSLNGGPATTLDGSAKGQKTFQLTSASDTFSITAIKNDPIGYTIPTGGVIAAATSGLSQPTNEGGFRLISDDTNVLTRFNSPRGVTVAANPNNPLFGTAYVSNSAAGNVSTGATRTLGDGLYAMRADQSDIFGKGDTAVATGFEGTASANSPFRVHVGGDHNLYIADFSDANGGVFRMSGSLTGSTRVLAGTGGPTALPAGQNHGSTTGVFVTSDANGITLYTVDEDLTSSQFGGGSTTDKNSLWRYDIGNEALPYNGVPTKLATVLVSGATSDLDRGANGNFYLMQNRSAGNEGGIIVLSADGSTVLFNSLTASRTLLGNPSAVDIFRNVQGVAVSPDQKYIAAILNNSDVAVMPLDGGGVPDIANRLVINTGTDINSGRDIAFDAAGNIHYVSSGQALYRVLAPGGYTEATTSWNGSSYEFVMVPEPTSAVLAGLGGLIAMRRRRGAHRA